MRVIARKTLKDFWKKHANAEQSLKAWFHETKIADWKSFSDIKVRYHSVDLLPGNRVVFNLKGNTYRLVVHLHFNTRIVYVRFIGTHAAYDKIDATTIQPATMKPKVLKTASDHQAALAYVARLMAQPAPDETELELWSLLVEHYEEARFPIATPDPIEAIRFRMEQAGMESADLHPYLQSKSKVSEVMNGKRALSLSMIRALHRGLKIPAEVLVQEPASSYGTPRVKPATRKQKVSA